METNAFRSLVQKLPNGQMALDLFNGFERYEEQNSNDQDAKLTKDLDKFDMIMQAFEYEEKSKKGPFLQDFFDSTQGFFQTVQVQNWDKRLRSKRQEIHSN